uniref:Uncharacterized protein n=1 Tax=Quercus lobata TaxID=97700 RepID=A0A7N2M3E3_QUELO
MRKWVSLILKETVFLLQIVPGIRFFLNGVLIPRRPIFPIGLTVKKVHVFGVKVQNYRAINALLKGESDIDNRLVGGGILEKELQFKPSFNEYLKAWSLLEFVVGEGTRIRFWLDRWIGDNTLKDLYPELYVCLAVKDACISEVLWIPEGGTLIQTCIPWGDRRDTLYWQLKGDGKFDTWSYYHAIRVGRPPSSSLSCYPFPMDFDALGLWYSLGYAMIGGGTTFLQYPWPFSWDLLLADSFIVSHLQEKCMDDYRARVIPDLYTFNTMLDACIAEKKWDDFENIYRGMLHHGFHFNAKCHLRMILNASGAVNVSSLSPCYFISWHKGVLLETTWNHLAKADRTPPPALVKEKFCMKLENDDYVAALACITSHSIPELQAFSNSAWLNLLKENAHRFSKDAPFRLIQEVSIHTNRTELSNLAVQNLISALGNPLLDFNTDFNFVDEYFWSLGLVSDYVYALLTKAKSSRTVVEYAIVYEKVYSTKDGNPVNSQVSLKYINTVGDFGKLTDILLKALKDRLMTKNVAEEIAEKLCNQWQQVLRVKAIEDVLVRILTPYWSIDILRDVNATKEQGKPYVVVFVGVNGVGKSTNLAKVAYWLLLTTYILDNFKIICKLSNIDELTRATMKNLTQGMAIPANCCFYNLFCIISFFLHYDLKNLENSSIGVVGSLVKSGIRALVYSGDQDSVIPFIGTRTLINGLAKELIRTKYNGALQGMVGGWTQVYGNTQLSFASIREASHTAPAPQPERSLVLFKAFLAGQPLPKA